MRRPRYIDFECSTCGHREERFVETNDDCTVIEEQYCNQMVEDLRQMRFTTKLELVKCEYTDHVPMQVLAVGVGYVKTISEGNSDYNERQRERLKARSLDHWNKKGRHEAKDRQRNMERKLGG